MSAFSTPTTLPARPYSKVGTTGPELNPPKAPANRTTPGRPLAWPWPDESWQLDPGLNTPPKVNCCPLHGPPPLTVPVALKASGPLEGMLVMPGERVKVPVGAAGVPPQVHVVLACAADVPGPAKASEVVAMAVAAAIVARCLIP